MKKTCSNTAPTAPTLSIRSTSAARNFLTETLSLSMFLALFDLFLYFLGDALNDFALANPVLRAVPCGHSRKSFHRRAIVNGATVSAIRHLSLSHGKKFAYLRLNKIDVLDFCPLLVLSLQRKTANLRNIHNICP